MEATKDREESTVSRGAGCVRSVAGAGPGLVLGALTGIVVGLAAGVGIAILLGVL